MGSLLLVQESMTEKETSNLHQAREQETKLLPLRDF